MSNIPTPPQGQKPDSPSYAFEHLLNNIISTSPKYREVTIKPILLNFMAHSVIKELLAPGNTPTLTQAPLTENTDLKKIQDTLSQLSKAVEALKSPPPSKVKQKASTQATRNPGPTPNPTPRTFSAVAGARPPNPSLVVDLAHLGISQADRVKPINLCYALNQGLRAISPPQVELAAVRWTAKGNLVITGGPSSTPHSLQLAAPHISTILPTVLSLPIDHSISPPRANVKWSKILINGVPTNASPGEGPSNGPASSDLCHSALAAINPFYATLTITQKPSWVRPPSSYTPGSVSSLSVAFEDPDGSKLKLLLAERYLFLFGHRAQVKKWKYRQTKNKGKSNSNTTEHDQGGDKPDDEDVDIITTPANSSSQPTVQATHNTRKSNRKPKATQPPKV